MRTPGHPGFCCRSRAAHGDTESHPPLHPDSHLEMTCLELDAVNVRIDSLDLSSMEEETDTTRGAIQADASGLHSVPATTVLEGAGRPQGALGNQKTFNEAWRCQFGVPRSGLGAKGAGKSRTEKLLRPTGKGREADPNSQPLACTTSFSSGTMTSLLQFPTPTGSPSGDSSSPVSWASTLISESSMKLEGMEGALGGSYLDCIQAPAVPATPKGSSRLRESRSLGAPTAGLLTPSAPGDEHAERGGSLRMLSGVSNSTEDGELCWALKKGSSFPGRAPPLSKPEPRGIAGDPTWDLWEAGGDYPPVEAAPSFGGKVLAGREVVKPKSSTGTKGVLGLFLKLKH